MESTYNVPPIRANISRSRAGCSQSIPSTFASTFYTALRVQLSILAPEDLEVCLPELGLEPQWRSNFESLYSVCALPEVIAAAVTVRSMDQYHNSIRSPDLPGDANVFKRYIIDGFGCFINMHG